jgi:AcrR family transcriptional regulator
MTTKKYHHGDLKNALIQAGVEILSLDGVVGLSLRKVAKRAGVSHTAPYAHFADKEALIAAISTEGYRMLYEELLAIHQNFQTDPLHQLVEAALAYVRFAQTKPAHFRVTFANSIEREENYPALVEMSGKCLEQLILIMGACQEAGILRPGPAEAMAISVWSAVHGFTCLLIERQISHPWLKQFTVSQRLCFTINQFTLVELSADEFPLPELPSEEW